MAVALGIIGGLAPASTVDYYRALADVVVAYVHDKYVTELVPAHYSPIHVRRALAELLA